MAELTNTNGAMFPDLIAANFRCIGSNDWFTGYIFCMICIWMAAK